jgi:hypothetical protein
MKQEYVLCQAKVGLTATCATEYTATGNGGTMTAHCEDTDDKMAFIKGNSSRSDTTSLDWFNVGTTAFLSLSLNNGVTDGDASNARTLTELILQENELNPALPSPAEAIAVMAGCTLLMSAEYSPFDMFWVSFDCSAFQTCFAHTENRTTQQQPSTQACTNNSTPPCAPSNTHPAATWATSAASTLSSSPSS